MFEAKALVGEKAGEIIYAKDPSLTHDLCKIWKIYCPECTQFLYFSKSKNPDKRRSYFGHYDYEDKRCPERSFAVNQGSQLESLAESHEQDLETSELFIEQFLYGIDSKYFQGLNQENSEKESQQVTDAINWFKTSFLHDCENWIRHYCETKGFLDWNNPDKAVSYLMDWIHVVARRKDVAKNLINYVISRKFIEEYDANVISKDFGLSKSQKKEENLIWIIVLQKIINLLSDQLSSSHFKKSIGKDQIFTPFLSLKIASNKNKMIFKTFTMQGIPMGTGIWYAQGAPLAIKIPRTKTRKIMFARNSMDSFLYIIFNDSDRNKKKENLSEKIRLNPRPNVSLSEKISEAKSQGLSSYQEYELALCIDSNNDLVLRGQLKRKVLETAVADFAKAMFNQSWGSMIFLLDEGLISVKVAEKLAQLSLKAEYEDLNPVDALRIFKGLSGYKERMH